MILHFLIFNLFQIGVEENLDFFLARFWTALGSFHFSQPESQFRDTGTDTGHLSAVDVCQV